MALRMAELGEFKQSQSLAFTGKEDGLTYTAPAGNYPVVGGIDEANKVQIAGVLFTGVNESGERINEVRFYNPSEILALVKAQDITLAQGNDKHMLQSAALEKKVEQKQRLAMTG